MTKNFKAKPFHRIELDYMSPKIAALQKTSHSFALILLSIIAIFIFLFLVWASFTNIDVVTRAIGQVVPSLKTQVISHLEGGIVKEILVKEGDFVQAGQVLMRIDPKIAQAQYKTNREQYLRYLATVERLQAQLNQKEYQVPEEVKKEFPLIAEEEMRHYQERKKQIETQKSIAQEGVQQKKQELEAEKVHLTQSEEQLSLSQQELDMVSPLVVEQLISKREVLRLKRDIANLKGEIAKGKAAVPKAQAALDQAQLELDQVTNRFDNEDQEQLRDIKIKLADEEGAVVESQDRMVRTELRAPLKGIVKEIKIKSIGAVIRPGEEVMTVVPYEDTLLVEAKVAPSEIAFIHPDQEATIKVTAYDYTIYGYLKGRLLKISADTIHDPDQKKDYYWALLQTDKNYLEYRGKKLPIIPGMNVEVDILTGNRTVLTYFLKPLIKGIRETFKER